ncbi:DivIVA domain-containing protein [Ruminococcaceae bacterium OttesenSCG-928-D13]|nr:DivIVA domain-containing protein [Ruminococcaceae bacterium OttesenSCG-928-D13]
MTSDEIRNVTFEQARKGYRAEDVDDYLLQIAADMDNLAAERDAARADLAAYQQAAATQQSDELAAALAAKQDAEAKMYVLAEKVEEYRGMEDNLKNALINAQRMGETVVYEAKQKAEQMLREATGQSELITQKAEREIARERATLEKIQAQVKQFKSTILNLYKQHIESLSALDPPTGRAQEVLDEFEAYRGKEGSGESIMEPETAPLMGTAAPQLPSDDEAEADTETYVPLGTEEEYIETTAEIVTEEAAEQLEEAGEPEEAAPIASHAEPIRFEPVFLGGSLDEPEDE